MCLQFCGGCVRIPYHTPGEDVVMNVKKALKIALCIVAALVLAEEGLDGKQLFAAASGVLRDGVKRAAMERSMASLGVKDATERIYETVTSLLR